MSNVPVVSLKNVCRHYDKIEALRDVSIDISPGEVHALVGEHGAGKSTLAMIVSGMVRPTAGSIFVRGQHFPEFGLSLSNRLGIRMVYQQIYLNEHFTVAENLFYADRTMFRFPWNSTKKMNAAADELLKRYDFDIEATTKVKALSLSDRTVVDILKQLSGVPLLLVLDEALEKLSAQAFARILPILIERKNAGMPVLFVTHRIDDIYSFADRVSIIRNGQMVFSGRINDIGKINLLRLAYTQISIQATYGQTPVEFMEFLKYNEAILEHLPISLLVVDIEGNVKLANQNFKAASGLDERQYLNKSLAEVLSGIPTEAMRELGAALRTQSDKRIFNVTLSLNGEKTLNNLKTLAVFDAGVAIGYIVVIEDITDYDQLQRQVILSDKLASVGYLAAGVAHEINNPLEVIYNYLTFLRRRAREPEVREAVNRLRDEFAYISTIVSNLVNLASPERAAVETVNLNELIGRVLDLVSFSAEPRKIRVVFNPGPDELRVDINGNEMKQVLLNVVKNAFEAMAEGGTVTAATRAIVGDTEPLAEITVDDTGPGITAEKIDEVFLPFYSTKKSKGNNVGLGLSISYTILERYRGKLSAANLASGGCRISIRLPLQDRGNDHFPNS